MRSYVDPHPLTKARCWREALGIGLAGPDDVSAVEAVGPGIAHVVLRVDRRVEGERKTERARPVARPVAGHDLVRPRPAVLPDNYPRQSAARVEPELRGRPRRALPAGCEVDRVQAQQAVRTDHLVLDRAACLYELEAGRRCAVRGR